MEGYLIVVALLGCKKDTITEETLSGFWTCDSYDYYYWAAQDSVDSFHKVMNDPCYLHLEEGSGNNSYYGFGTSRLPLVLPSDINGNYFNSDPIIIEGSCAIEKSDSTSTSLNGDSYIYTTVLYGEQLDGAAAAAFKMVDHNHLNMTIYLRQTVGLTNTYTRATLQFSR